MNDTVNIHKKNTLQGPATYTWDISIPEMPDGNHMIQLTATCGDLEASVMCAKYIGSDVSDTELEQMLPDIDRENNLRYIVTRKLGLPTDGILTNVNDAEEMS